MNKRFKDWYLSIVIVNLYEYSNDIFIFVVMIYNIFIFL